SPPGKADYAMKKELSEPAQQLSDLQLDTQYWRGGEKKKAEPPALRSRRTEKIVVAAQSAPAPAAPAEAAKDGREQTAGFLEGLLGGRAISRKQESEADAAEERFGKGSAPATGA